MAYFGVDPSRLGLDSAGSAGNEDLFLKVFSGEVLTTFEENNVMLPLTRVRTISSGKTAQFPVTGVASAVYHTPGDSIFADEAADGRFCLLSPDNYYQLLTQQLDAINRDYNPDSNGSISAGDIVSVAGVRILKSNHIPTGNEAGGSADATLGNDLINNDLFGAGTGYSGQDFSGTCGVVFQTEGVGTVKLMDLSMESEYYMERLGTMLLAKYAMGHGVLREEALYLMVDNT